MLSLVFNICQQLVMPKDPHEGADPLWSSNSPNNLPSWQNLIPLVEQVPKSLSHRETLLVTPFPSQRIMTSCITWGKIPVICLRTCRGTRERSLFQSHCPLASLTRKHLSYSRMDLPPYKDLATGQYEEVKHHPKSL